MKIHKLQSIIFQVMLTVIRLVHMYIMHILDMIRNKRQMW